MAARKNTLLKYQTITNASMASNVTSAVTSIQFLDNVGLQLNFSGSPVGSFQAQVSADYAQDDYGNVTNPGTWTPIILTYYNGTTVVQGISVPTTQGSPIYLDLNQLSAPYLRVVYTAGSGSGTLNALITAKML